MTQEMTKQTNNVLKMKNACKILIHLSTKMTKWRSLYHICFEYLHTQHTDDTNLQLSNMLRNVPMWRLTIDQPFTAKVSLGNCSLKDAVLMVQWALNPFVPIKENL